MNRTSAWSKEEPIEHSQQRGQADIETAICVNFAEVAFVHKDRDLISKAIEELPPVVNRYNRLDPLFQ